MKIQELTLYTSQLAAQKEFYGKGFGLPLLHESKESFGVQVGASVLNFVFKKNAKPYHLAFNIPSNQEVEALHWLQQRAQVLNYNGIELIDFVSWNAKSVYCYDPDRNLVELIARKNLFIENKDPFSSKALLNISEVGVPVTDIETCYNQLNELVETPVFDGDFDRFCAVGNEEGLLILINKLKRNWFPTNDRAYSTDFKLTLKMGNTDLPILFQKGQLLKKNSTV